MKHHVLNISIMVLALIPSLSAATIPVVTTAAGNLPQAKPVEVTAAHFAIESSPSARDFLAGQTLELPNVVQTSVGFLKLNAGFEQAVKIKSLQFESCGTEFSDGLDFYFHPGQRHVFVEGGKRQVKVKIPDDQPVRSFSIVFGHSSPTCLKSFELLDMSGRVINLNLPLLEKAKVDTENATRLFDLDFQTPTQFSTGIATVLQFESEKKIERLYVWNGDQLTTSIFKASGKLKGFSISAEAGSPEQVELKSTANVQKVELKTPLVGKRFSIKPAGSGSLSEIRFGWGQGRTLSPETRGLENRAHEAFQISEVADVLDHELTTRGEAKNWHFRFRSDSSYFVYGYNEGESRRGQINSIGRFEIVSTNPKKIKLRLRGTRMEASGIWDGWICGPACGEPDAKSNSTIDETIVLERLPAGIFMIRNRNSLGNRSLLFTDLKSKVSSLSE